MRLVFDSIIGVRCAIEVQRDNDTWVVCLYCPVNDRASACARARDLALAIRALVPCYREYSGLFGRVELMTQVRVCEQYA